MTSQIEPTGHILTNDPAIESQSRAFALNPRIRIALASLACTALLVLPGCDEAAEASPVQKESVDSMVEHLIELSTELDPTLTSDHHDRHLHARRAYLAELRQGSRELGLAALARFQEVEEQQEQAEILVRVNLLDVAAHTATEDTTPLLEALTLEYGHRIDIRTEATLLLGQVAPARAVEILTPLLKRTKNTSTMPEDEFLLKAFVLGCEGSGQDPVPILADVATNLYKQDAARHQAVRELGKHKTRHAQQALRTVLVESTGNAYLRRIAAQSIRNSFPREEACAIFELIASREADNSFLNFLGDMIEDNCE